MFSTCVSPRSKSPEPWVRPTTLTSADSGRMSVAPRPSRRMPSVTTRSRMRSFSTALKAFFAIAR